VTTRKVAAIGSLTMPEGPVDEWPLVSIDGVAWRVAPVYVAPIGLRDVFALADAWECEVPTRELVDAVWRSADVRLDPWRLTRAPNDYANGQSPEAIAHQRGRLERLLAGRAYRLLVGYAKDFAATRGRLDLYGWHQLTGAPIEPGRTSHDASYDGDYSQGLRLVRRVAE